MEYAYPPWHPWTKSALIIDAFLIAVQLFCWFLMTRRKATLWLYAVLVLTLLMNWMQLKQVPSGTKEQLLLETLFLVIFASGWGAICWGLFRHLKTRVIAWGVAIIGVWTALCFPDIGYARRAAKRMLCISHLRLIDGSIQNYASTNLGRLPWADADQDLSSWRINILPLIDQAALYKAYCRDKPWDDPANESFSKTQIDVFACPSNPVLRDREGRFFTAYALLAGSGSATDPDIYATMEQIEKIKGLSQTMFLGEACGRNIVWNEPRDIDVNTLPPGVNLPGKVRGMSDGWLSSVHGDTANIALADGSVKSVPASIDPKVLKALTSPERTEISLDGGLH